MKTTSKNNLNNESGFALVTTLLIMVVMITLVPAAISLTSGEMERTSNFNDNREAFFLAEAGLEHAKFLTEQTSLREALAGPDNLVTANSGDAADDDDNGTFNVGTQTTLNGDEYNEVPLNGNSYYIRAFDNEDGDGDPTQDVDNMIFLTAVGIVDNTTTTVEALVHNPPGIPIPAIATNGDLNMGGNGLITGACGHVHANGNIDLSGGSLTIDGNASATGTVNTSTSTINGTVTNGAANYPVPDIAITELKPYADYIFKSNGQIFDKAGNNVGAGGGPGWNGWKFNGGTGKWTNLSGSHALDGFMYFEGDVQMGNVSAGTPTDKWELTIVGEGYVDIIGNSDIVNYKNPALPVDIQNLYYLAGTDLSFNGDTGQLVEGLLYAREQIALSGDANIAGAVMAYNEANVEMLVNGSNTISGNPTITYECGLTTPTGTVEIEVVSWNEVTG